MIRIVIADDHPIVRQGLQRLIEQQSDMRLIREVPDGRQALQAAEACDFDILILDLSLPRVNGLEVLRRLHASHPEIRIIVLSMYPADQYEARLLQQGAAAYVVKDAPPTELLRVIRAVSANEPTLAKEVARPTAAARPLHASLTAREYQIFTLLFQGGAVTEIAAELNLSASTVSNHVAKIREKLGVRSISGIVRYALEAGLVGRAPRAR